MHAPTRISPKDHEAQHGELTSARHIYREPASYLKLLYQQPLAMDILQIHHHRAGWHYADDSATQSGERPCEANAPPGLRPVPPETVSSGSWALSSAAGTAATV
jgi:hypothetical protein